MRKVQQFSAMHDFSYQPSGLRVWKAFQVGPGKLIPWDDIDVLHQRATELLIEEENFDFTSRKITGILTDSSDEESSEEEVV